MGCCAVSLCRQSRQSRQPPLRGQGTLSAAVPEQDPSAPRMRVWMHWWDAGEEAGIGASCSPTLQLHMHNHHGQHSPYAGGTCWGELEGSS